MKIWVLVYDEHFSKYLDTKHLETSVETFQSFLKDIGTVSIQFQEPKQPDIGYIQYKRVPPGTCIRLHTEDEYRKKIYDTLFRSTMDKSRRANSCTIV